MDRLFGKRMLLILSFGCHHSASAGAGDSLHRRNIFTEGIAKAYLRPSSSVLHVQLLQPDGQAMCWSSALTILGLGGSVTDFERECLRALSHSLSIHDDPVALHEDKDDLVEHWGQDITGDPELSLETVDLGAGSSSWTQQSPFHPTFQSRQ